MDVVRMAGRGSGGRTLHLVDVENLLGTDHRRADGAVPTVLSYLLAVRWRPGDHVVVAGQPGHVVALGLGLPVPHLALVAHPGPDGADRRLTDHDTVEHIARRYERLALGSGDHHFVPMARAARALGAEVLVAHRPGSLHRDLRRAASSCIEVPPVPVLDLTEPTEGCGRARRPRSPVLPEDGEIRELPARRARRRPVAGLRSDRTPARRSA